jgi:hypothetical protein
MAVTFNDEQGAEAVQFLQGLVGIELTLDEALNGRPEVNEPGWKGMTDDEKEATENFYHLLR